MAQISERAKGARELATIVLRLVAFNGVKPVPGDPPTWDLGPQGLREYTAHSILSLLNQVSLTCTDSWLDVLTEQLDNMERADKTLEGKKPL